MAGVGSEHVRGGCGVRERVIAVPYAANGREQRAKALSQREGSRSRRRWILVARRRGVAAGTRVAGVGDDDVIGEGLVETALLCGLVVAQLGLAETAKKLLCAREIGENVFGDDEVGTVEDGDQTGEGDEGVVARQHANGAEDGVGVGGDVFEAEARRGIEIAQVERLVIGLEKGLFFQRSVLWVMRGCDEDLEATLHNHKRNRDGDVGVARDAIPHNVAFADGGNVVMVVVDERNVHTPILHQIATPLRRLCLNPVTSTDVRRVFVGVRDELIDGRPQVQRRVQRLKLKHVLHGRQRRRREGVGNLSVKTGPISDILVGGGGLERREVHQFDIRLVPQHRILVLLRDSVVHCRAPRDSVV